MNYIFLALLSAVFVSITDICNKSLINKGVSNFKYTFWTRGVVYGICIILLVLFVIYNPSSDMTNDDTNFSDYEFPNILEFHYTKEDLFKYFDVQKNLKITNTPQVWGGSFFIKKTKKSMKILNEHFEITRKRFDLIDDDPSKFIEKSRDGFIQHRHSQSVLSIIVKLANCKLLSAYESEWALNENKVRTFSHLEKFPIIAKRDKKKNIYSRFIDRQRRTFNRYKKKFGL